MFGFTANILENHELERQIDTAPKVYPPVPAAETVVGYFLKICRSVAAYSR